MPANIAGVWRNNLEKIINFLDLIKTGVQGFVKSIDGQPLRNATIHVVGNKLPYSVTKNLGHFRIILPAGPLQLLFTCDNYEPRTMSLLLNAGSVSKLGDVILSKIGGREIPNSPSGSTQRGVVEVMANGESTGTVTGYVLDTSSHPVSSAKVIAKTLKGDVIKETESDSLGAFKLENLPVGDVKLTASAKGMVEATSAVHVLELLTSKSNIFHLENDEHVWGMPRLLFIIAMGCLLVGSIACVMFCVMSVQKKKKLDYSFSLLEDNKDRPLFEDDEDDEEDTEVYRAPIKSE